jgi:hypothetical protein
LSCTPRPPAELGDYRRFSNSDDAVHYYSGLDITVHEFNGKRSPIISLGFA